VRRAVEEMKNVEDVEVVNVEGASHADIFLPTEVWEGMYRCRNNVNYQIRHSVFGLPQHLNCSTLLASLPSLPIMKNNKSRI
jgi:hypothetical protein